MKEGIPVPPEENFIGEGQTKRVYVDPASPDRVIAFEIHESDSSPNEVKGRYYLGKILHLLFPDNLADVHVSASNPEATVRQRLDLEDEYNALQKIRFGKREEGVPVDVDDFRRRSYKRIDSLPDEERIRLIEQLADLGVILEKGFVNFVNGKDDKLKYVEIPEAFQSGNRLYDPEKLREAIDKLDDVKKAQAISYLERLEALYEDEAQKYSK